MKNPFDRADRLAALRIIAIYALFSAIWIYFSDQAVGLFIRDREMMVRLSVYKGFLFILVTSLLLYKLIARNILKNRKIEKDLRRSRNLIDSLVEGTTDAVFVKDRDGRYLLLNSATADFIGRPAAEIVGKDDSEIFAAEEAGSIISGDRRVMAGGKVMTIEDCLTTADGVHRTFLATKGPVFDDSGELCGLFGISRDITGLKLTEKCLLEKQEEMERFTYMVSHELKSPLVTIKTFLGYLGQDIERCNGEKSAEDMYHIREAADKMGRLLDELLEISRIGNTGNSPVRVSFRELVDEALGMVAGEIASRGVEIRIADADIVFCGDRPRLEAVWQNLLENAVKYMGAQESPVVEIGIEESNPGPVFFVRDNGMGLDPDLKDKIFGYCFKIDPSSEGTGLGLAMTKRIVELCGGEIRVDSEGPGRGACFRFTLPDALLPAEEGP